MPNVNKVILMGVLGRDPETKQFPNGGSIAIALMNILYSSRGFLVTN